ncbi:hypothetical protein VHN57_19710 [Sphingobium sp. WW5]|uniref:hypothetical protein n=1 Tax=unclassified Sphingobium TaxID=2611147 RepID=UPI003C1F2C27
MTRFERSFDSDKLIKQLPTIPLLRQLMDQWQLPGPDAAPTDHGLRLAVRAGYLNIYAMGQSVARISLAAGRVRLDVHHKYLGEEKALGRRRGDYVEFAGMVLAHLPDSLLDGWVRKAIDHHSGAEKRFVDDLVRANAGIIDLEMALPGDHDAEKEIRGVWKKVAPRMDLVLLQRNDTGVQIAFWEAKCGDNGEVRAAGPVPHVHSQLKQYVAWLNLPGRGAEVIAAYRRAAATLLDLAVRTGKTGCHAMELWRQAGADAPLDMMIHPAIVIGNYCALNEERHRMLGKRHDSFHAGGVQSHHAKLTRLTIDSHQIRVQEYGAAPDTPLPALGGPILTGPAPVGEQRP